MTYDEAFPLWNGLVANKHEAVLGYSYHERMVPNENYSVSIQVGPGRFAADRLEDVISIAGRNNAEVHLIGNGLVLLPKRKQ